MGCCMGKSAPAEGGQQRRRAADPTRTRPCTDLPALGLFTLYVMAMLGVAALALWRGDPWRVVYGWDSYGNTCGADNRWKRGMYDNASENLGLDLRDKPYVFSMDIRQPADSLWICVERCPALVASRYDLHAMANKEPEGQSHVALCSYEVPLDQYASSRYKSSLLGPCPVLPVYNSTSVLHRCIPEAAISILVQGTWQVMYSYLNELLGLEWAQFAIGDIVAVWRQIAMFCVLAVCVSLVGIFLMSFLAGFVVYIIFIGGIIICLAATGLLWWGVYEVYTAENEPQAMALNATILQMQLGVPTTQRLLEQPRNYTMLIYAAIASLITLLLVLVICCLWSSARMLADLFRETSYALRRMPVLLLQPVLSSAILLVVFLYWLVIATALSTTDFGSNSEQRVRTGSIPINFVFVGRHQPAFVKYMWWMHTVGCLWLSEAVIAGESMLVAGATATWYFARKRKSEGGEWTNVAYPVCVAYKHMFISHLGSLAFGAAIITIVRLPRLILMWITARLKASQNYAVQKVAAACSCCLYCVERCLRYINHNAYAVIMMRGVSFCPAAKQAVSTLAAGAAYVASINSVGGLVLLLAKCACTAVVGVFAALVFKADPNVHFYAVPLVLTCVFAYLIARCCFSVYEMVMDTLFLCFAEDRASADSVDGDERGVAAEPRFADFMRRSLRAEGRQPPADMPMRRVGQPVRGTHRPDKV